MDEPCKGLHHRDVKHIIQATLNLVNHNNTVIAIEHNKQYIKSADNIIQLGPVGGPKGGYILENSNKIDCESHLEFKECSKLSICYGGCPVTWKNFTYRMVQNHKQECYEKN